MWGRWLLRHGHAVMILSLFLVLARGARWWGHRCRAAMQFRAGSLAIMSHRAVLDVPGATAVGQGGQRPGTCAAVMRGLRDVDVHSLDVDVVHAGEAGLLVGHPSEVQAMGRAGRPMHPCSGVPLQRFVEDAMDTFGAADLFVSIEPKVAWDRSDNRASDGVEELVAPPEIVLLALLDVLEDVGLQRSQCGIILSEQQASDERVVPLVERMASTCVLIAPFRAREGPLSLAMLPTSAGFGGVMPAIELLQDQAGRAFIRAAHEKGLGVISWIADDAATLYSAAQLGSDAIVTNRPARMVSALLAEGVC